MKTDLRKFIIYSCTLLLILIIGSGQHSVNADYEHVEGEREGDAKIQSRDVKCLVCKATIDEMQLEIKKVDPKKIVEVSGFRIDASGNSVSKTVQLIRSETYLTELTETICKKFDDYAKARYKDSRKLTVLKMTDASGGMNPDMSIVDFVYDGDLNKSLEHFCLEVLEDHEDSFLREFMQETLPKDIDYQICTKSAKYCDDEPEEEEYNREQDDEREEL